MHAADQFSVKACLLAEVHLYREWSESLETQIEKVMEALEITRVNYNNLELQSTQDLERLETEVRDRESTSAHSIP